MEITYINSKNIKISLSREELSEKGLAAESIDYSSTKTKRFIWELLDKAYDETGFDAGSSGLYVRVFPSSDGGCELFVSKHPTKKSGGHINTIPERPKSSKSIICRLDDADKLFMLCKRLRSSGFRGRSQLFSENDSFILVCRNERKLPSYINERLIPGGCDLDFACEYGSIMMCSPENIAYLGEHCELICDENAVEKISG